MIGCKGVLVLALYAYIMLVVLKRKSFIFKAIATLVAYHLLVGVDGYTGPDSGPDKIVCGKHRCADPSEAKNLRDSCDDYDLKKCDSGYRESGMVRSSNYGGEDSYCSFGTKYDDGMLRECQKITPPPQKAQRVEPQKAQRVAPQKAQRVAGPDMIVCGKHRCTDPSGAKDLRDSCDDYDLKKCDSGYRESGMVRSSNYGGEDSYCSWGTKYDDGMLRLCHKITQ